MDVSNQPHALYNTTDSEWSINKFHYIIFIYLRTQIYTHMICIYVHRIVHTCIKRL